MNQPDLTQLLQCRDLCNTLLLFCDCPAIGALSGTHHEAQRACSAPQTLWKLLCVRDFPTTRWQLFDQHSHARFSTIYRICASRECYAHCALCDERLRPDDPDEPRFLLMCPCLRMPQYIVAHAQCLLEHSPAGNEPKEDEQPRIIRRALRNSAATVRRHVMKYRCPFCHQIRTALKLWIYSL